MPPNIPILSHLDFVTTAADHDDFLDGSRERLASGVPEDHRVIDVFLERNHRAAAKTTVRRDDHFGSAVLDAVRHRLGAEAAKHDTMHRTDARAGQHGDGRLGNHG